LIHRFNVGQLRALGSVSLPSVLLLGCTLLPACTLITDVNREDIPTDPTPVFPEDDAGSDAAVSEPEPVTPVDAGTDAGEALSDAGVDASDGDGGNGEIIDASGDAD
jgi:hypothetical protein